MHAFTAELSTYGSKTFPTTTCHKTLPDTEVFSDSRKPPSIYSGPYEDDTLMAAMELGMKKVRIRKSGLETSILSAVAEGDEELASTAYSKLSVDPMTGKKKLDKKIVETATSKARIDVNRVAALISRAQNVSICFLLDTTRRMIDYIFGVKEQIVEIVRRVEASGCQIAGLAFVGYKDWDDGNIFLTIYLF